jgi:site-specific DNA-methyltransferase (cytosine-N4-specific)
MVLIQADAGALPLRDGVVQAVVTSPPYWGMRDYGHGPQQLGFEAGVADFVTMLVKIFDEARRVLRDDGTLWVVIGDSHNTRTKIRPSAHNPGLGHKDTFEGGSWALASAAGYARHSARAGSNLKDKDLAMVPARFAIAMVDAGWYLRSEVVWVKPMTTPEHVDDRPSKTHEMVYLFAKTHRGYKFYKTPEVSRTTWQISPGSDISGPAVFPSELVRRCILASTDQDDLVLDPFVGSGTTEHTARLLDRRAVGCDLTRQWFPGPRPSQPELF